MTRKASRKGKTVTSATIKVQKCNSFSGVASITKVFNQVWVTPFSLDDWTIFHTLLAFSSISEFLADKINEESQGRKGN
jgi:hypothetical protein